MKYSRKTRKWLDEILSSDQHKPAAETTRNLNAFKKAANDSSSSTKLVSKPESPQVASLKNSKKRSAPLANDCERVEIMGQEASRAKKQKRLSTTTAAVPATCEISSHKSAGSLTCESPVTVLPPLPLCDQHGHGTTTPEAGRVAMLKSRFAVTILKAQRPEAPAALIEKCRSAELARANKLIKKNRQRDREAARLALIEMEKNVDIDDPFKTMREFATIISDKGNL